MQSTGITVVMGTSFELKKDNRDFMCFDIQTIIEWLKNDWWILVCKVIFIKFSYTVDILKPHLGRVVKCIQYVVWKNDMHFKLCFDTSEKPSIILDTCGWSLLLFRTQKSKDDKKIGLMVSKASISLPQISSQIPKLNPTNIRLNVCIHFLQTYELTLCVLIDLRFMVWVISVHLMPNTSLIFILYFPLHWAKQALQSFLLIWKIYMRVSCDQCI